MPCQCFPLNTLQEYRYVVVLSRYEEQILLSRHKKRSTWETQGGHIEPGETPLESAKRELFEESGAVDFEMVPLCDYRAWDDQGGANGVVFFADIHCLEPIPQSEMAETKRFDTLPDCLTYPAITPVLFDYAAEYFRKQEVNWKWGQLI